MPSDKRDPQAAAEVAERGGWIRVRGAAATGAQHTREREPLRIESQLGCGALQASPIWSSRRPKYPHKRDQAEDLTVGEIAPELECPEQSHQLRLLPNWSALSARDERAGAVLVGSLKA
jgi:hypothetical protein